MLVDSNVDIDIMVALAHSGLNVIRVLFLNRANAEAEVSISCGRSLLPITSRDTLVVAVAQYASMVHAIMDVNVKLQWLSAEACTKA